MQFEVTDISRHPPQGCAGGGVPGMVKRRRVGLRGVPDI